MVTGTVPHVATLAPVPVVVVPATYGWSGPHPRPMAVPAVEWMAMPRLVARSLAAYLILLGQGR